jgi:hypothetical protein
MNKKLEWLSRHGATAVVAGLAAAVAAKFVMEGYQRQQTIAAQRDAFARLAGKSGHSLHNIFPIMADGWRENRPLSLCLTSELPKPGTKGCNVVLSLGASEGPQSEWVMAIQSHVTAGNWPSKPQDYVTTRNVRVHAEGLRLCFGEVVGKVTAQTLDQPGKIYPATYDVLAEIDKDILAQPGICFHLVGRKDIQTRDLVQVWVYKDGTTAVPHKASLGVLASRGDLAVRQVPPVGRDLPPVLSSAPQHGQP